MRIRWRNLELPSRVVCQEESRTATYGAFIAEPFERGFGITVGNSLRRILLSSIEGSAVTAVRVGGVKHEFSTIPNVIEDVTEIILNVKKILVKLHGDKPKTLKLEAKKKGSVTAGDIIEDPEAEIVNKDLVLCTLADSSPLTMEFDVRHGRGYVPSEEHDNAGHELGTIPVDAVFSPVLRVKYWTENTRVGKMTNYDRLNMEIWTDGTVTPEDSLVEASRILRKHLNPFIQFYDTGDRIETFEPVVRDEAQKSSKEKAEILAKINRPVSDLDLSVRASNCLEAEGVTTIRELVSHTENEMLNLRNFGKTSLKEVKKKLSDIGLSLGLDLSTLED